MRMFMNVERMRTRHIIVFVVAMFAVLYWSGHIVIKVDGDKNKEIPNYANGVSNIKDDNAKQGTMKYSMPFSSLTEDNSKQGVKNDVTTGISDSNTKLGIMNYTGIMSALNRAKVSADNKMLVDVLRKHFIQPPSTLPYNLKHPNIKNPSPKQAQLIDQLLKNKTGGFYVDSGAHDGEHLSNSLFFERFRSWNGVLIEPNPVTYKRLKSKNRKAYTLNACLSVTTNPELVTFHTGKTAVFGKIVNGSGNITRSLKYIHAQCFPLYSVLLALGQLTIDYFSLDVEGAELGVLESLPWDKVDIRTISIEWNKWKGGKRSLIAYMAKKGYSMVAVVRIPVAPDLIFIKNNTIHNIL